jgi:hypothetical protein
MGILFALLWLIIYMALLFVAVSLHPDPDQWPSAREPAMAVAALLIALAIVKIIAGKEEEEEEK